MAARGVCHSSKVLSAGRSLEILGFLHLPPVSSAALASFGHKIHKQGGPNVCLERVPVQTRVTDRLHGVDLTESAIRPMSSGAK